MTNPVFSIITVTFNNLPGLKKTAQSVIEQTNEHYEWLVIDGGSDDGTTDFLKTTDSLWISEPDKGLYDAMNKGIDRAKGEYLVFLNAGDTFTGPHLLGILEKDKGADLIYGDSFEGRINQTPAHKEASSHEQIDWGLFTHHQAIYYKKECIDDLRYDLSYEIAADYDFTRRFLKKTDHVDYIHVTLCLFEPGGVSQRKVVQARKEQFQIRKKDGVPWLRNALIYFTQTLAYTLRLISPTLYWLSK